MYLFISRSKTLFLLVILLMSPSLFSIGNSEVQISSTLKIDNGDGSSTDFIITRQQKAGTEIINFTSSSNDRYKVHVVNPDDIVSGNLYTEMMGRDTLVDIESAGYYSAPDNIINDLIGSPDSITFPLMVESTTMGLRLISQNNPSNSYQMKFIVNPSVTLNPINYSSEQSIVSAFEENRTVREFIKSQFLGDSGFTSTKEKPIPLAELDNNYIYELKRDVVNGRVVVEKSVVRQNLNLFDAIYNYGVNGGDDQGESIIQKILRIYFDKNKPLFHYYIDQHVGSGFDYNQYRKLTETEGKELVEKALKYLSWGVEYSLDSDDRVLDDDADFYPSRMMAESDIEKWISDDGSSNREENYFPGSAKAVNSDDYADGITLNTPFNRGTQTVSGFGLPYVEGGIDSPRTFNFKMQKQKEIIDRVFNEYHFVTYGKNIGRYWVPNSHLFAFTSTGRAVPVESYYFFYGDGYSNLYDDEPFFHGRSDTDYYTGSNLTGVDSLGLLSGSLSMTGYYDKILGILNDGKLRDLDDYYSFKNGAPDFKEDPDDTGLLRLSREDIEKTTVIVPDLDKMQPGDLLVHGSGDNTVVAIVVDTGHKKDSSSFDISKVLVITVTGETERTGLYYWGNNREFGSFTPEPKNFLLRRLIQFTGDLSGDNYDINTFTGNDTDVKWDAIIPGYSSLEVYLDYDNSGNNGRWIPNTGELFQFDSIKFGIFEEDEFIPTKEYNNSSVIIKPPTDLNFESSSTGHNIDTNMGDGFAFYAVDEHKKWGKKYLDSIRLATFKLDSSGNDEFSRYKVEYDGKIFDEDGITLDGYNLYYSKSIGVTFKIDGKKRYTSFAIRPLESNIRPGDDILLNFDLLTNNITTPAVTPKKNYLAVYDKKFLWRANLYINTLTGIDWNKKNPWNADPANDKATAYGKIEDNKLFKRFIDPETGRTTNDDRVWYDSNEWNLSYDGDTRLDGNKIEVDETDYNLDTGDGKQVVSIKGYKYIENITGDDSNLSNVAYAYGCSDSPFEFNDELLQQKQTFDDQSEESFVADYSDYIKPSEYITALPNEEAASASPNTSLLSGNTMFPFLPGWALHYYFDVSKNVPDWINAISAGVDCIGFATRSASYSGNQYSWIKDDDFNQKVTDSANWYKSVRYPYYENVNGHPITSDLITYKRPRNVLMDLEKIKPGDLMYTKNSNNKGEHIAIVQDVTYSETMKLEDIKLIESTWYAKIGNNYTKADVVSESRDLSKYEKDQWVIVRLKVTE